MSDWFPTFRRLAQGHVPNPFFWPWYTTSTQRRGLLRMIAVGIEEKLTMAPLLDAFTDDQRGVQRRRLHRLVALLQGGVSLADAVEQVPGVLRDEEILAIRFDAQSGTVTKAVREILDDPRSVAPLRPRRMRSTMRYVGTVVLLGFPVVVFIQMKIMPAYNEIFSDYGLEIPGITQWSERLAVMFGRYSWLLILAVFLLLIPAMFTRTGRFFRRAVDRLGPLKETHVADLLKMLAITTSAGRPIAGALSTLARYHFDPTIRRKLLFVRNEIEQGADTWHSMNDVELITNPEARVLIASERVGNRSWALRQLAYGKTRQATRYIERVSHVVLPVMVLLMGAFVLLQAAAVFVPIIRLISGLAK